MSTHRISPIAAFGSLLKPQREAKRFPRPKREHNAQHLADVRILPCTSCGANPAGQAAHVRLGTGGGMGLKPPDRWVVPLCFGCHERQHRIGELRFWSALGINPVKVAAELFAVTGNLEKMRAVVFAARERRK